MIDKKKKTRPFKSITFVFCVTFDDNSDYNNTNYSIYKAHFTEKEEHVKVPVKFCQDVGKQARTSVF